MRQIEYRTDSQAKVPVVFLMSPNAYAFYKIRLQEFGGNHAEYLGSLINRSGQLSDSASGAILTGYQARNLALRRYAMRLPLGLYLQIGQIAAFLGVSRCLLIALLIKEDQASYGLVSIQEARNVPSSRFLFFVQLEFDSDGALFISRRCTDHTSLSHRLLAGIRLLL